LKKALLFATLLLGGAVRASAQKPVDPLNRYDDTFRKYSKRYFGPTFDWQYFKAQALAESGLDSAAQSRVGARGVMQLMPGTYALIKHNAPGLGAIENPEWNIAAGIMHERGLWYRWKDAATEQERIRFMFGSYNAGEGPILRARGVARANQLDAKHWNSIETVAPKVSGWRYRETLPYVRKIEKNHKKLIAEPRRRNAVVSR
jgi:membrane-bound lytic murein transglycosylase F